MTTDKITAYQAARQSAARGRRLWGVSSTIIALRFSAGLDLQVPLHWGCLDGYPIGETKFDLLWIAQKTRSTLRAGVSVNDRYTDCLVTSTKLPSRAAEHVFDRWLTWQADQMAVIVREYRASDHHDVQSMADRLAAGVAPWRDTGKVTDAVRGWVVSSIAAADDEDAAMFVADISGVVVGFVSVTHRAHWSGEVDGYIGELVVRADHEGCGIGRTLVAAAERWARERGLARIRLATGAANQGALRLYNALGYEQEDVTLSRSIES